VARRALAEDGAQVFKQPGGEGDCGKPYLMPPGRRGAAFTAGLLKLGLSEIDEMAQAAGLRQETRHGELAAGG